MKHLIDKAAVVAAIKTIYNEDYKFLPSDLVESIQDFKDDLLTALDGLSTVKEVDLEEELSNYIKHYRNKETGYTMLGIAEHFFELGLKAQHDNWKVENLWKPADGDDLPIIDREVIALLDNGKVVFAHRPPEYWDGKDIITGKVTRNYVERYDKGLWNIPNVKWWLDVDKLPNVED